MGARANYVLIEGGVITVYYSHWGAMSVPAVVIDGPEATSAYIQEMSSTESLMNDIWAEGGILLDADRRALLFFGGENIRFSAPWQRIFLYMMRRVWQGWSVTWAGRGIVDIASYPGVAEFLSINPSDLIKRNELVIEQPYTEVKVRDPHQNPRVCTVITVTWEDGRIGDYTFDDVLDGYLLFGVNLLDILREREPDALPREENDGEIMNYDAPDQAPREGAYFDIGTQAMWVWYYAPWYSGKLERIEPLWPGWSVHEHFEGLGRQVVLSGRNPELVAAPYDQVERELIGDLMHNHDDSYPLQYDGEIDPSMADSTTIASHLFRVVHPVPPPTERRAYLTALLQQALRDDAGE